VMVTGADEQPIARAGPCPAVVSGSPLLQFDQEPRWHVYSGGGEHNGSHLAEASQAAELSQLAWAGFSRARGLAKAAAHARALAELGQALTLERGLDGTAHLAALATARLVPCDGVQMWLRCGAGADFKLAATAGYPPRRTPMAGRSIQAGAALAGACASRRLTSVASAEVPELAVGTASAILVPVGERLGNRALIVIERTAPLSDEEERLLNGIADQTLLALDNQQLLEERERAMDQMLICLGRALEVRHRHTAEHSDHLIDHCRTVAHRMGLRGPALTDVVRAAALHDLGKIGVPEQVLNGTGPLDDEGWRLIRTHPELGARIIEPVAALSHVAEIVRACHEHWDGGGYPRGLRGDQIPLGARIVLACDAYHAMTEERTYQPAMSEDLARERLVELSGAHFDPAVVDVLLELLAEERAAAR
jgi:hypothetical protein